VFMYKPKMMPPFSIWATIKGVWHKVRYDENSFGRTSTKDTKENSRRPNELMRRRPGQDYFHCDVDLHFFTYPQFPIIGQEERSWTFSCILLTFQRYPPITYYWTTHISLAT
jgi:hypothetical protein